MATTKITDLSAYSDPVNTDVLPIVDVTSDVTKKVSIANVMKNASLGTAAAPGIAFDGDPNTGIYSPGADEVAISTNGTGKLRVTSAGAVEIVGAGTIGSTQAVSFNGSAPVNSMVLDSSGRLLVGTSSYSGNGKLVTAGHVGGNAGTFDICWAGSRPTAADTDIGYIRWYSADNSGSNAHYASIYASSDGASSSGNDIPGRLVFSTTADGASTPTERMRIGNAGGLRTGRGVIFGNLNVEPADTILIGSAVISSGAGNSTLKYNVSSGLVTYDTSSRLVKESIEDCPYGIKELKQLQPRKYFRTDDQRQEIGFIADEIVQVMPEFVPIGAKSVITKNNEDTEQIPLGVNYEKLSAVLTKALQEAIAKIETLEQRLNDAGIN
jgi:hypothetical protein